MTLCVTSPKSNLLRAKELAYSPKVDDIVHNSRKFKEYLETAFAKTLSFELAVFSSRESHTEDRYFKIGKGEVCFF